MKKLIGWVTLNGMAGEVVTLRIDAIVAVLHDPKTPERAAIDTGGGYMVAVQHSREDVMERIATNDYVAF